MTLAPSNSAHASGSSPAPGALQAERTCGRCGEAARSNLARYCARCGLRLAPPVAPPVRRQPWYHVSWLLPLAIVTQEWERALSRWARNKRAGIVPFTRGVEEWGLAETAGTEAGGYDPGTTA